MGLILPVAVEEVEKRRERMNEMALIIFGNNFNKIVLRLKRNKLKIEYSFQRVEHFCEFLPNLRRPSADLLSFQL